MVVKILNGGESGDLTAVLGAGNDTVWVVWDPAFHYTIRTWAGDDVIDTSDAHEDREYTIFSGTGNDTVFGGAGTEFAYDNAGNDLMFLGDNNDSYDSGKGNDTVFGGSGFDAVGFGTLYDAAGNQTNITTGSTCDLAITGVQDFGLYGKDRISGFEKIYGGDGADRFFGNGAVNVLNGNGGNDLLDGRAGDDDLDGDVGRDRLIGGRGADRLGAGEDRDTLTGGAGADEFDLIDTVDARDVIRYTSMSDSGTGLSRQRLDVIEFFDFGAEATADRIDLSAIDANRALAGNQAFIFRGANAFSSAAGEVRLEVTEFGDTLIQVDIDGDGASEMNILMDSTIGLTVVDFIL